MHNESPDGSECYSSDDGTDEPPEKDHSPTAFAPGGSLCEHCASILNLDLGKSSKSFRGLTLARLNETRLHCRLCEFVFRILQDHKPSLIEGEESSRKIPLHLVDEIGWLSRERIAGLVVSVTRPNGHESDMIFGLRVAPTEGESGFTANVELESRLISRKDANSKLRTRFLRQPFRPKINKSSWVAARRWLNDCTTHHPQCRTTISGDNLHELSKSPPLPSRVIHCPPTVCPRLVEPKGLAAPYATLSYCWGSVSEDLLRLQKTNLKQFLEGLPIDKIPRTIKDAIEATRLLGLEYLWVDSFTIIQDDDEDWEREAANMAVIYSNSLCTMAVLGDRTSQSGFLDQLNHVFVRFRGYFEVTLALPFRRPPTSKQPVFGTKDIPPWEYPELQLAQEKRISKLRHINNFWAGIWAEDALDKIETGVALDGRGRPQDVYLKKPEEFRRLSYGFFQNGLQLLSSRPAQAVGKPLLWILKCFNNLGPGLAASGLDHGKMLAEYSKIQLSESSDRLLAFEGIASAYAKCTSQSYQAGLWSTTPARDLFWYSDAASGQRDGPLLVPTWCWACRDGPIRFFTEDDTSALDSSEIPFNEPETWLQGGWNGSLEDPIFQSSNKLMQSSIQARGVRFLSLAVKAPIIDVTQNSQSCAVNSNLWDDFVQMLRPWPDGYHPWVPNSCHWLFIPHAQNTSQASLDKQPKKYYCSICKTKFKSTCEQMLLNHAQRCSDDLGDPKDVQENTIKFIGIARFDNSDAPPSIYRAVILWNNSDRSVFYGEDLSDSKDKQKPNDGESYQLMGHDEAEVNASRSSKSTILGLKRCTGLPRAEKRFLAPKFDALSSDLDMWQVRKIFHRRKRGYFLLLVEPVGSDGSYRRVGIGVVYWIPGVERFGGVDLLSTAKIERITLLSLL
ncbi:MAG: hypothetical protein M1820_001240 [Bogoriella megaspora]|nr:MAG: hypothetical protein M1820_001240 [Bogoriella megaspora]